MAVVGIGIGATIRRPDSFTKLHLRMNGEGNVFKDLTGKAITAHGNATQSATSHIYNGNSGIFDGNSYITTPANVTDFNFGSGDFTLEASVIFTDVSSGILHRLIGFSNTSGTKSFYLHLNCTSGYGLCLECWNGSGYVFRYTQNTTSGWNINTKYNIMISRVGTYIYICKDRVLLDYITTSGSVETYELCLIGSLYWNGSLSGYLKGYCSEVRISKGIGRLPSESMLTRRK